MYLKIFFWNYNYIFVNSTNNFQILNNQIETQFQICYVYLIILYIILLYYISNTRENSKMGNLYQEA